MIWSSRSDFLAAAREMADTGRPALAWLLAGEAAALTADPAEKARILADFPLPRPKKEG